MKFLAGFFALAMTSCSNHIEDLLVPQETVKPAPVEQESKVEVICSLTLDANGGEFVSVDELGEKTSEDSKSFSFTEGEGDFLPKASELDLRKAGHTFLGWMTEKESGTVAYGDGVYVAFAGSVVLHARWSEDTVLHTLTFDANGGSVVTGSQAVADGTSVIIPNERNLGLKKVGSVFGGWMKEKDSDKADFVPGDTASFAGDTVLFARWLPESFRVTFDANGGDMDVTEMTVSATGTTALLTKDALNLRRDGYFFGGWSVLPDDNSVLFGDGAEILPEGDITLYAVWTEKSYIEFIYDGLMNITGIRLVNGFNSFSSMKFSSLSTSFPKLSCLYVDGSVRNIPDEAFSGCQWLTEAVLSDGIEDIGIAAFKDCENLASVSLPDSLTAIGDYAFQYCFALSGISIPGSVSEIGDYAFQYCIHLNSVTLSEGLGRIGVAAFKCCPNLENLNIPGSVAVIDDYAFEGCFYPVMSNFVSPKVSVAVVPSVASPSIASQEPVIPSLNNQFPLGLKSVTISDSENPSASRRIGIAAFKNCEALTDVSFPDSLTEIGEYAFQNCYSLESVSIPGSVKAVSDFAFTDCTGLSSITLNEGTESIGKAAFKVCGYKVPEVTVTLPDSLTSIGEYAFQYGHLKSVSIPGSVTEISDYAFQYCGVLETVTLNEGTERVGIGAFKGCSYLGNITIPDSITVFDECAFEHCGNNAQNQRLYLHANRYDKRFSVNIGYACFYETDYQWLPVGPTVLPKSPSPGVVN